MQLNSHALTGNPHSATGSTCNFVVVESWEMVCTCSLVRFSLYVSLYFPQVNRESKRHISSSIEDLNLLLIAEQKLAKILERSSVKGHKLVQDYFRILPNR